MKKGILFVSIASVAAIAGSFAFVLGHNNTRIEVAKAADKSIEFNSTTNLPAESTHTAKTSYKASTYKSGSGDQVDVSICGRTTNDSDYLNVATGGSHFLSYDGESYGKPRIRVEIGVNGLTSLSVRFGVTSNVMTYCDVKYYDVDSNSLGSTEGKTSGDVAETTTYTVESLPSGTIRKIEITVYPWAVYPEIANGGMFIDSIVAGWSC